MLQRIRGLQEGVRRLPLFRAIRDVHQIAKRIEAGVVAGQPLRRAPRGTGVFGRRGVMEFVEGVEKVVDAVAVGRLPCQRGAAAFGRGEGAGAEPHAGGQLVQDAQRCHRILAARVLQDLGDQHRAGIAGAFSGLLGQRRGQRPQAIRQAFHGLGVLCRGKALGQQSAIARLRIGHGDGQARGERIRLRRARQAGALDLLQAALGTLHEPRGARARTAGPVALGGGGQVRGALIVRAGGL
ncbi:hypothetical protein ACFSUI_23955 [Ralstonia solanacearum]